MIIPPREHVYSVLIVNFWLRTSIKKIPASEPDHVSSAWFATFAEKGAYWGSHPFFFSSSAQRS
jgi:hypothetical protein